MDEKDPLGGKGPQSVKWQATPAGRVWHAVNALYRPLWYVRDRHGDDAAEDLLDWMGKELSEELVDMGVKDHFELANWFANHERQLFGTEVEVDVSEGSSTITVRNCPRMTCAVEWRERARGQSSARGISREEYCRICTKVYLSSPAEGLKLDHQHELTGSGCVHALNEHIADG